MRKSITHSNHIGDMSSDDCVSAVKQKLSTDPGVISVTVDLAKKKAEIISSEKIRTDILRNAFSNTR